MSIKASADPDTMYLHQDLKHPDKQEFIKAMEKEFNGRFDHGNFTIILRSQVPKGTMVLPTVW